MRFNKRNLFKMDCTHLLTGKMGQLLPIHLQEVVPGDVIRQFTDLIIRVSPLLAPIMHQVDIFTHFFYVPTRILQKNWESFITGGDDGQDATVTPTIKSDSSGFAIGSLADYLGLPTGVPNLEVSAFPFRAYAKIYNDWYRDENLIPEVGLDDGDGLDTTTNTSLLMRCWMKDYFTSSLPFPQKGDPVYLPLGTSAVVKGNGMALGLTDGTNNYGLRLGDGNSDGRLSFSDLSYGVDVGTANPGGNFVNTRVVGGVTTDGTKSGLIADLADATAATINDIRTAFQIQKWMELQARSGSRLVETILSHFGIRVSDGRLQRSQYLGGGRSPLVISETLQTSSTDATSPQGNMSGHGIGVQRSHSFTAKFEEHGYIIGILSVMPKTMYQQGVDRMWNRRTRFDWLWPVFSHLGEQGVLQKELYAQGLDANGDEITSNVGGENIGDSSIFGYQPRYEEYRHNNSKVHGQFKSTLDFWHMGREFATCPTLSDQFVRSDPTERINAVTGEDNLYIEAYHHIRALRPLPKHGTPGLIDHG